MANLVTASEVVTAINEACSEQDIDGICIRRLKSSALDLSSVERKNVKIESGEYKLADLN